jgi:hypothetical protein
VAQAFSLPSGDYPPEAVAVARELVAALLARLPVEARP